MQMLIFNIGRSFLQLRHSVDIAQAQTSSNEDIRKMNATIWHNPDCGTSRKTLAILQETLGLDLTIIEYRKQPFERAKLIQLFRDADLSPREALRTRGSPAEELGLIDGAAPDAILDAMVVHPILVERPFVETDRGVLLCRPQEKVRDIL